MTDAIDTARLRECASTNDNGGNKITAGLMYQAADMLDAKDARIAELEREVRNLYDDMAHDHDAIKAGKNSHMQQAARIAALEAAMREAAILLEVGGGMWALEVLNRAMEADRG